MAAHRAPRPRPSRRGRSGTNAPPTGSPAAPASQLDGPVPSGKNSATSFRRSGRGNGGDEGNGVQDDRAPRRRDGTLTEGPARRRLLALGRRCLLSDRARLAAFRRGRPRPPHGDRGAVHLAAGVRRLRRRRPTKSCLQGAELEDAEVLEGATCAVQVLGSTPSMSRRQNCSAAAVAT